MTGAIAPGPARFTDARGERVLVDRLGRGSIAALAIYTASAGLAYTTQLAIARIIGAGGYGIYAYVIAWVTVAAYFSALGFDVSLLRFVPAYRAQGAHGLELGVLRFAERLVVAVGAGMGMAGAVAVAGWGAALPPLLAQTGLVGCALVPVWALLWVRNSATRACGGVVLALAPERIGRDGLLLAALLLAGPGLGLQLGSPAVMAALLASSLLVLTLVSGAARRLRPPKLAGIAPAYAGRIWLRAGVPLMLIGSLQPLMDRTGVMLLGWLGTVQDAGIFAAAFNIAFLALLPRTAVIALFAPAASHLFARGDHAGLQALIATTGVWTLLGAVAIALPVSILAVPLLAWFGDDFAAGAAAMRVLLVGQVFAAAAGPQLSLLTMTGQERAAVIMLGVSAAAGGFVGAVLIGPFAVTGAAIGATAALVLWNVAMAVLIWRRLHLLPGSLAALRIQSRTKRCTTRAWQQEIAAAAIGEPAQASDRLPRSNRPAKEIRSYRREAVRAAIALKIPAWSTGGCNMRNSDEDTVRSFGRQWTFYDQSRLSGEKKTEQRFEEYFNIFPWESLPDGAVGADVGCGSGRWALRVAPRVGVLHCIDASAEALAVARRNLADHANCQFHHASVDAIPLPAGSLDFCYSLGVLHHVPDTSAGIEECVNLLKPGAPLLVYLYYALEHRPLWYRLVWRGTDVLRRGISQLPYWPKRALTELIAATVYWPLARLCALIERQGYDPQGLPLSWYRDKSFYTLRTNAFDRFGTPLEQRFSRIQIERMMRRAGLDNICFSENPPFWCAVGLRRNLAGCGKDRLSRAASAPTREYIL
jgi:O-antigen/teichoic acid export membrane protein/ubiquinone/menaquinone biosynthesis C-methylase UbiE